MLPSCKSTASLLYHIARNSRGSLPVYSDIRNGGTRHLVLIRNVDGNLSALANDITTSLLNNDPSAKVSIARNRHLVIRAHGLVSKNQIAQWLAEKGF
ncbi:ribosomal protein L49/IMG2 [Armillaria novae-zelandiae]|uniref:Large ribosomal subunit protein mL49 n=2 Tax=Armillaria TaxID=47424 RepID=A0AA39PFF5_9AGAR|nr:ribosomal protein L49/IMG2 [Armillaria novae-zelandiae]KAK0502836.1 ribosomal protein L49/IMG2 [Armillaria luteobubalina]